MSTTHPHHPNKSSVESLPQDYEPVPFVPQEGQLPNCDFFLDQYMRCVRSKPGLSHVDDCPEEAWSYKECIDVEKAMGQTIKQRYYRDASFLDLTLDNMRLRLGFRSNNPEHKTYVAPPPPIIIKK